MAIEVTQEDYSVPWQGVTYEAVFFGYRYPCVVAIHHLKMKIGKEAPAEFRTRHAEAERATEGILRSGNWPPRETHAPSPLHKVPDVSRPLNHPGRTHWRDYRRLDRLQIRSEA